MTLAFEGVEKRYSDGAAALAGVSFAVRSGQFCVVRGPSVLVSRVFYQLEGWEEAYRFIALRYKKKKPRPAAAEEPEQYQLFDTPE